MTLQQNRRTPKQATPAASRSAVPPQFELQPAPPQRATRARNGPNELLISLLWVLLGMIGGVVLLAGYLYFSDFLAPGVSVLGVDIGAVSTQAAMDRLTESWTPRTIRLEAETGQIEVAPATLGITFDVAATVDAIHARSRTWTAIERLISGEDVSMSPVLRLDQESAAAALRNLTPGLEITAIDAAIDVVDGRAVVTEARNGRAVDINATVDLLSSRLFDVVAGQRIPLILVDVPARTTNADLANVAAEINGLLSSPINIELYDPILDQTLWWTVSPAVWGEWLAVDLQPGDGTSYAWGIVPDAVRAYLAEQSAALGAGRSVQLALAVDAVRSAVENRSYATSLRLFHNERTHTVQSGETLSSIAFRYGMPYPWLEQANPGAVGGLFAGQTLVIPSPDLLVPLPVVRNKRVVVSISEQRMWAYENGNLKWEWQVSTGIDDSPTSPGVFQVQSREVNAYAGNWDLWMPYFIGIYRPVPNVDFMNGFHGFPTRNGADLLWTGDLGRPVTFGCVLVSTDNAAQLFEWVEEGVVVEVKA